MSMIYVKPSSGGRIRMPERNFEPMPADGAFVPRDDFYEQLLLGGDVVACDPPLQPACNPETPASDAPSGADSRAASPKEEN